MTTRREQLDEAREELAQTRGQTRAKDRREAQAKRGELSTTAAGLQTAEANREAVAAVIQEVIDDVKQRDPNKKPYWFKHFCYHPVDATAEIALRCVLDGVGANWTRNNLVMQLAGALNASIMNQVLMSSREGRRIVRDIVNRVKSKPGSPRNKREQAIYLASRRKTKWTKDRDGNPFRVEDVNAYVWAEWDQNTSVSVGGKMLAAVMEATDLFEEELTKDRVSDKNEHIKLKLTDAAAEQLASRQTWLDKQSPQFGPMFNTPYPWDDESLGPYENKAISRLVPPVKHWSDQQQTDVWAAMKDGTLDDALEALNSLQEVPLAINRYVVSAIQWVLENDLGHSVESFPNQRKAPPIEKEAKEVFAKRSTEEKMEFSNERLAVQIGNREVDANNLAIQRNLEEARKLGNEEVKGVEGFFLPHQWDYRGRVYHTPEFGFHNTDYLRAMFLFANKDLMTNENIPYLTLQIANTYGNGVDKETLEYRQDWAIENEAMILLCGRNFKDPVAFEFWRQADDPFQFLAACREWFNGLEASKRGEDYYTGLPIALDATQSGIQVYAAMGRNLDDGKKVNLTANDRPGDLYTAVMHRSNDIIDRDICKWEAEGLDADVEEKDDEREKLRQKLQSAKQWKAFGLTRKTVKRNCMTWAYSSEEYGFAEQLRKEIMEPLQKRVRDPKDELTEHPFGKDKGFRASWYMAVVNHEAIRAEVKSAADGMDFFQDIVRLCNDADIHLKYTTPLGFPVYQNYRDREKEWVSKPVQKCDDCGKTFKLKEVRSDDEEWTCSSCGHLNKERGQWKVVSTKINLPHWDAPSRSRKMVKAYLVNHTDEIKDDKSIRACAPNLVHSLDATILMKTVLKCREQGIKDMMTVHDSFSTTIGNVETMAICIRQAFFELFDGCCPYTELLKQTLARLPDIKAQMMDAMEKDADATPFATILMDAIDTILALDGENRKIDAAAILVGVTAEVPEELAKRYVEPVVRRVVMIPDIPKPGDLPLEEVKVSTYAFS